MIGSSSFQIDYSLIASAMNARINQNLVGTVSAADAATTISQAAQAEIDSGGEPPWRIEETDEAKRKSALSALRSGDLISASDSRRALKSDLDTPKLFAAYDALAALHSLASSIADGGLSSAYADRAQKRILEGLTEVSDFLGDSDLKKVTLLSGERLSQAVSDTAIKRGSYEVTTKILHSGDEGDAVAQWAGVSGFTMTIDRPDGQRVVNVDLSGLADADRTLENVTDLINTELESAGAVTRFSQTKIGKKDDKGIVQGDDWGLKITSTSTESISFSTASDGPSLYLVGASGEDEFQSAQLSKWTSLTGASPTRASANIFAANEIKTEIDTVNDEGEVETETKKTPAPTQFLATATDADGAVYALVETEGSLGEQELRGEKDLALVKYDSTGREIWTRMVGASDEITGTALAVSDDGRIAIGGSTKGDLSPDASGGGEDGFVLMYDTRGVEVLSRQQGSGFDDAVTSLAFDSDGSLFVGGRTKGALDDSTLAGGADAYVEKLDSSGERVWINTFGTSEDDSIAALTSDGAGGVIVASKENGQAVLRSVTGATFGAGDFEHTVGDANIASIAYDSASGALYAAGETRLDADSAGQVTGSNQDNIDAFALRLDVSGATASANWFQRLGGANDQTASSILVEDGAVYLAGTGNETFGTTASDGDRNAFITSLDATSGAENWTSAMAGRGGVSSAAGLAFSATGDNDLDAFGLPSGKLQLGDVNYVSDRTSARVGDHFYLSVGDGREKKIELEEGDTYRALTFKINAALVLDGQASARRGADGQTLKIEPKEGIQINLRAGDDGQDLLDALGLPEGVIYNAPSLLDDDESSSDAPPLVALGLSKQNLSLADEDQAQKVVDMLDSAMRGLRKAYRYATEDPTLTQLTEGNQRSTGTGVSAYQSAQLANLQAGLARLTGGGGASSGGLASLFA